MVSSVPLQPRTRSWRDRLLVTALVCLLFVAACALPAVRVAQPGFYFSRPGQDMRGLSALALGWTQRSFWLPWSANIAFLVSWIFFLPNIVVNSALPITGPLAALLLLLALAVKLSRRVDDDVNAYRLATVFLVLGATLYYGPQVFAVEAASQDYLSGFANAFTSNTNPVAALWIMWISLAGVVIIAGWLFVRVLVSTNRTMARRLSKEAARRTPEAALH